MWESRKKSTYLKTILLAVVSYIILIHDTREPFREGSVKFLHKYGFQFNSEQ
jgi:hypothetical protein